MKNLQEQMAGMKIGKSAAKTKPYNKPEQGPETNGIQPKVSVKATTSCSEAGCGHKRKHDHDMKKPLATDNGEPQRDGGGVAGRHCDCVSCEVFGASNMQAHTHKTNETRDRLRTRLSQRKEGTKALNGTLVDKVAKFAALKRDAEDSRVPPVPEVFHPSVALPVSASEHSKRPSVPLAKAANLPKPAPLQSLQAKADVPLNRSQSISSVQTSSLSENGESRDINDLVNFIEGKKAADKEALAKKKAEKKARQKQKKAEEREKVEEEKRRQERERLLQEKRKEEERLKAEAFAKKILEQQRRKEEDTKNGKKNKKKGKSGGQDVTQETIPAMVTITRARDDANAPPTITITLKSNTSDHEQLISSLVGPTTAAPAAVPQPQQQNNKKKKKQQQQNISTTTTTTGEVRLKIAVEDKKRNHPEKLSSKQPLSIPALRLPPGITITKIEGPPVAKGVPGSRAGFTATVIDTEKIRAPSTESAAAGTKSRRRNRKKNQDEVCAPSMVTLKNPIFHTLQTAVASKNAKNNNSKDSPVFPAGQQASFFKNENGIVTIRNPRLQSPLDNGSLLSNFLADLKLEEEGDANAAGAPACANPTTNFNAQKILSGLPGIEITKVDKKMARSPLDNNQSAEVSIIQTGGSKAGGVGNCTRLEWPLENVFAPRGDVADDDMDAEEREIEAFKRFCQQSVPPEQKEKVAHLNVRDIVLRKKDVSN